MMHDIHLFAVTAAGARPLPLPENATGYDDLYDDLPLGVYSALRTFSHDKFLRLEAHLDRLRRSMAMLGWSDYELDEAALRNALQEVCTASPWLDSRLRLDVLAEPALQLGSDSRVLITRLPFKPLPNRMYDEGVRVGYAHGLTRNRPQVKTANYAVRRREYLAEMPEPVVYEYLMVDSDGYILEGTGSNFYGMRDGAVYTAGEGMLEGITRKIILELLSELEIPLRLEKIHTSEVDDLDEAAMSGSSRALLPVVEIGGKMVGDGRPGPISRRILAAYHRYVERNIKPARANYGESRVHTRS